MKLSLVLVHGVGNTKKNWADQIIPAIEKRLKSKLKNILGKAAPAALDDALVISCACWEGIFRSRERSLRQKFDGFPKPMKAGGLWWFQKSLEESRVEAGVSLKW